MLPLIQKLVAHKGDATDVLIQEVLANEPASADGEIRALLNHILVANRFWSALIRGVHFDVESEVRVNHEMKDLRAAFQAVQDDEAAWLATASDADLARELVHPLVPGLSCSIAEGVTQVCLHTHGHRAQLMTMLRRHGVAPAPHDFIIWLARLERLP